MLDGKESNSLASHSDTLLVVEICSGAGPAHSSSYLRFKSSLAEQSFTSQELAITFMTWDGFSRIIQSYILKWDNLISALSSFTPKLKQDILAGLSSLIPWSLSGNSGGTMLALCNNYEKCSTRTLSPEGPLDCFLVCINMLVQ